MKRAPPDSSLVVLQVSFRCAKNCTECPDGSAEHLETDGNIDGGGARGKGHGQRGRPPKYKRECNVLLIVSRSYYSCVVARLNRYLFGISGSSPCW